ncbi:hypothetical protein [Polyangium mundeleinium]|uniref:Lipoprotein n=1 Tax=Polyangium mundeleinium TaxID=2995306 RepID=A0ABT5EVI9_9BACT|nr:hypothetical protein [Polyangium mundeleinium]MDC0745806.1 hypothetical protein [Polyangium mundeleinium]
MSSYPSILLHPALLLVAIASIGCQSKGVCTYTEPSSDNIDVCHVNFSKSECASKSGEFLNVDDEKSGEILCRTRGYEGKGKQESDKPGEAYSLSKLRQGSCVVGAADECVPDESKSTCEKTAKGTWTFGDTREQRDAACKAAGYTKFDSGGGIGIDRWKRPN